MASLADLLSTKVTRGVVRRVAAGTSEAVNFFGFQPGGANILTVGHRTAGYDIFNDARTSGQGRAPGAPAASIRRNPVGRIDVTFPRMYEKLMLDHESLHNQRPIGGASNVFDEAGRSYIAAQQRFVGQRAANFRRLLTAGMMRGVLYGHRSGDDFYYDFTSSGADFTMDWRVPSGNKSQLNMLGGGSIIDASWATASTDIPRHLAKVDAAFQQLTGTQLRTAVCTGEMWNYITANDHVQEKAGTSNRPWETFALQGGEGQNGLPRTTKLGVLAAYPFVTWLITDEGLSVGAPGSESFTKFIPDTAVWFGPQPDQTLMAMLEGGEPVNEGHGRGTTVQNGLHAWTKEVDDPAGIHLFSVDNALPALFVPAATAYGTVVF